MKTYLLVFHLGKVIAAYSGNDIGDYDNCARMLVRYTPLLYYVPLKYQFEDVTFTCEKFSKPPKIED